LWDVVSNEGVATIVQRGLSAWDNESRAGKYRYITLAQDLVMSARGKMKERNWKRSNGTAATIDDISVFVIPILPYKEEYNKLKVILRQSVFYFLLLFLVLNNSNLVRRIQNL